MNRLSGKNDQKKPEQVHKIILDSVNNPVTTLCSASCPDPKHAPRGLDLFPAEGSRNQAGEGWPQGRYLQSADVGQHPRQLLQHVPTDIQSPQAPQAAHAPGQLPQLVPYSNRKANSNRGTFPKQEPSKIICSTPIHNHTNSSFAQVHTGTQRMSLPTKGNLGSKSPSQLRSLMQAGSVPFIRRIFVPWNVLPLLQDPGRGGRGLNVRLHTLGSEPRCCRQTGNDLSCPSRFFTLHCLPCFTNSSM